MFTQHQQINTRTSARTVLAKPEDYYDWKKYTEILLQEKDLWKYIDGSERQLTIYNRLEHNRKVRSDFVLKYGVEALTNDALAILDLDDTELLTKREQVAFDIGDKCARGVIRSTLGGIYHDMAMDLHTYPTSEALWSGLNKTIDEKSAFNSTYLISKILTDTVGVDQSRCEGSELQHYLQDKQEQYRRLKDMNFEVTLESLYALGLVLGLQGPYENFRRILISKQLDHLNIEAEVRREVQYLNYSQNMGSKKREHALVADNEDMDDDHSRPASKRSTQAKCTVCESPYHDADNCFLNEKSKVFKSQKAIRWRESKRGQKMMTRLGLSFSAHTDDNKVIDLDEYVMTSHIPLATTNEDLVSNDESSPYANGHDNMQVNSQVCLVSRPTHRKLPSNKFPTFEQDWIVDSGCTNHMTGENPDLDGSHTYNVNPISILYGNNSTLQTSTAIDVNLGNLALRKVLVVRGMCHNLISVKKLTEEGFSIVFQGRGGKLIYPKKYRGGFHQGSGKLVRTKKHLEGAMMMNITQRNGMYVLDTDTQVGSQTGVCMLVDELVDTDDNLYKWHRRLGHASSAVIKKVLPFKNAKLPFCHGCALGNQTQKRRQRDCNGDSTAPRALFKVVSDICHMPESLNEEFYFCVFVDVYSRFVWVRILKSKSEAGMELQKLIKQQEKELFGACARIRTDGGLEYDNQLMNAYYSENAIVHEVSKPYSHTGNCIAERINLTLTRRARTLLSEAGLSAKLWPQALKYSAYLYNRLPHRTTGEAPITRLNKHFRTITPLYSDLRIFGSKAYYVDAPDDSNIPKTMKKICPNGHECIYLGQDDHQVTLYCLKRRQLIDAPRTFLVNDGTFLDEKTLVEHGLSNTTDEVALNLQPHQGTRDIDYVPIEPCSPSGENDDYHPMNVDEVGEAESRSSGSIEAIDGESKSHHEQSQENPTTRSGVTSLRDLPPAHSPYVTVSSYQSLDDDGDIQVPTTEVSLLAHQELEQLMPSETPTSFQQAWSIPEWRESILREWNCLVKNNTWKTPEPNAKIRNVVGCKWVFKIKRDQNGDIVKYKSRLVAQGFSQKQGIDYDETFAPVATKRSLRCFLANAARRQLKLEQMDVETAFLSGDIDRQIFMKGPEGFRSKVGSVVELRKSIYGLKQAPRIFYQKLEGALRRIGFKQSRVDPCIHLKGDMSLLVYVDDLLCASPSSDDIDFVFKELSTELNLVRMGRPKFILGCEIEYTDDGMIMKQSQYIRDLAEAFNCKDAKWVRTPIEAKLELHLDKTAKQVKAPFGSLLGGLLYLACCTRPDICTAVSVLGQVCSNPTQQHWRYLKRILKYVKGTEDYGILFPYGHQEGVKGYCDANWGGCNSTSRSRSGVICTYNKAPVYWRSKKQDSVSLSSCEAEYYSISCGAKDILETSHLVNELTNGVPYDDEDPDVCPVTIYEDNQSCIKALQNDMVPPNLRHIRMRYHWLKEKIATKEISVTYVDTDNQLADGFSKCLGPSKFQSFKDALVKCSRSLGSVGSGTYLSDQ